MQKLSNVVASTLFLVFLTVHSSAGELSPQNSQLAASLGMLLGLPSNEDAPKTNANAVPKFLMEVHDCWTQLESGPNRASCLPVETEQDLNEVNVVRALKGTASVTNSVGFYSHSPDRSPLPPSLTYTFKMHPQRTLEELQYAYVQISKLPISTEQLEIINHQCSGSVSLQLLSKLSSTNDSLFTLLSSATLNSSDFGGALEVKFSGITAQFTHWQQTLGPQNKEVEMRLIIVGSSSCDGTFTPQNFGFNKNTSANIVVLAKSDTTDQAIMKAGLNKLATDFATTSRRKRDIDRSTENQTDSESTSTTQGNTTTARNESTIAAFNISSNYELSSCRLYSYNITLSDLGEDWNNIVSPKSYQANICAGSCHFPLAGTFKTKHSYIQSLAARNNPEMVPPPCCIPNELRPLSVIYSPTPDAYVVLHWQDMRAVSCGCK